MKGGEHNIAKGEEVKAKVGLTYKLGTVKAKNDKVMPDGTFKTKQYLLRWEDGTTSDWIPEANVFKYDSVIPPVPTAEGQGRRRKTRSKRSKRRKTHRR